MMVNRALQMASQESELVSEIQSVVTQLSAITAIMSRSVSCPNAQLGLSGDTGQSAACPVDKEPNRELEIVVALILDQVLIPSITEITVN